MPRWIILWGTMLIVLFVWAAPAQAQGGAYTVRAGDTLTGIAAACGVSVERLAAVNGLRSTAWVYVGQRLTIPGAAASPAAPAAGDGVYIVRWGDTLTGIAAQHGLSIGRLAQANGLGVDAWVYTGQRLTIPGAARPAPALPVVPAATSGSVYVVRPGDTLIGISQRYRVSTSQLAAKNGLVWNSWVYVGQKLVIPGGAAAPAAPPAQPAADKWIDVNLSTQTLTAFEGQTAVLTSRVSTGLAPYYTVVGTYSIYVKYTSAPMSGPGYYLPGVPYVMYFYRGYGLHGTYWHNNFGAPMSHGCVNLNTTDAQWLFNWAPVGTRVVTHY